MWVLPQRKALMWRYRYNNLKEGWTIWEEATPWPSSSLGKERITNWPPAVPLQLRRERKPILHGSLPIPKRCPPSYRYQILPDVIVRLCPALLHGERYVQSFNAIIRPQGWPSTLRPRCTSSKRREIGRTLVEANSFLFGWAFDLLIHGFGLSLPEIEIGLMISPAFIIIVNVYNSNAVVANNGWSEVEKNLR